MAEEEPKKLTPYISVKAKCPVCEKETPQFYIRSKLFQPDEVENDHHVVTYTCTDPEYSDIRPENYYIWNCPHCFFADESDVFRGNIDARWKNQLEPISEGLEKIAKDSNSFINLLGKAADPAVSQVTTEVAMIKHMLACGIQEEFLSPNNRIPDKLSRYYLRIAWLYREREMFGSSDDFVPDGYFTFNEYFARIKEVWPEMPNNEEEAIKKAYGYYVDVLDQAGRDDNTKKEIALMFLLLNLNRRIGDLDEAYKYVRSIFTLALQKRQLEKSMLDKGVQSGDLDPAKVEQIKAFIKWLSKTIDEASEEGDLINDKIFFTEYESARESALQARPINAKNVVRILRLDKFHEITCRKVANMCRIIKGEDPVTTLPTLSELKAAESSKKKEAVEDVDAEEELAEASLE